jgi:hypothetical protein
LEVSLNLNLTIIMFSVYIYLSFVSAFIQFDVCVGSASLSFVGTDMIGFSANLILYIYCFKLWKLGVFFIGSNWKWYFLFLVFG